MSYMSYEVNFDGIIGPTHNYGGLSYGNEASMKHRFEVSNPKEAALQGLAKMKFMMDLGVKQAVLPPHERPHFPTLRSLGFKGNEAAILQAVQKEAPWLISLCSSAASMFAANAATVTASIDSIDYHAHFTPANMASNFHRSLEAGMTSKLLKIIFPNPVLFTHHAPLMSQYFFFDEGSANYMRFCKQHNGPGVQLFVFGQKLVSEETISYKYPPRQMEEASKAIARNHQSFPGNAIFVMQNPEVINAGVFHNDVIATCNQNILFCHEKAFANQKIFLHFLAKKIQKVCDIDLSIIEVKNEEISLQNVIDSYIFNSQIVTLPNGTMRMVAPIECQENKEVFTYLNTLTNKADNPISSLHFIDLRQSMKNGGGPGCMRLKVLLNENELAQTHQGVILNEKLYNRLVQWVNRHYRTELKQADLADPHLTSEMQIALDELTQILDLGTIYSFQS